MHELTTRGPALARRPSRKVAAFCGPLPSAAPHACRASFAPFSADKLLEAQGDAKDTPFDVRVIDGYFLTEHPAVTFSSGRGCATVPLFWWGRNSQEAPGIGAVFGRERPLQQLPSICCRALNSLCSGDKVGTAVFALYISRQDRRADVPCLLDPAPHAEPAPGERRFSSGCRPGNGLILPAAYGRPPTYYYYF